MERRDLNRIEPMSENRADQSKNSSSIPEDKEACLETFHQHRALLLSIAYRMLGSWTDAEDERPSGQSGMTTIAVEIISEREKLRLQVGRGPEQCSVQAFST